MVQPHRQTGNVSKFLNSHTFLFKYLFRNLPYIQVPQTQTQGHRMFVIGKERPIKMTIKPIILATQEVH